jgi:5'-methylthioadenosine phosphorylase
MGGYEMSQGSVKIGIIGGSGLDNPEILKEPVDQETNTPYGRPSSDLKIGTIHDTPVVLLARHGRSHTVPPTGVNYRANLWALKEAGCTTVLATTAVGSLREEIHRGDLVILDQFIDFTRSRTLSFHTYFEPGSPVHTPMADPFDEKTRDILIQSARKLGLPFHPDGTVVTIEGPRFSTRAESQMFRLWGADVINMSIAPEAALCNELGIPYAAVAMSTDYDCWKQDEEPVSWEEILRVFTENARKVTDLLLEAVSVIGREV